MLHYNTDKDTTFDAFVEDVMREFIERFNIPTEDQYALKIFMTGVCVESAKKGFDQAKAEIQKFIVGGEN